MIKSYRLEFMEKLIVRLDKMLSGATVTEIALPEELVTAINNLRLAIEANISSYTTAKQEEEMVAASLQLMQSAVVLLLRRVRKLIGPGMSARDRRALRKQYGLLKIWRFGQERLVSILSHVISVSDSHTEPEKKLPTDILTSVQTQMQAVQEALDGQRHFKAEEDDLRLLRVELDLQYRQVRDLVYAFLMEVMPTGCRDPRLRDFGFRPSILRRRPESPDEMTAITEVESVEPVVVETETEDTATTS